VVKLHTWLPLDPALIFEGFRPDAGHSSMEVISDDGTLIGYVSYWPEQGSLIGQVTQMLKPRPQRYPGTYQQEIDPEIGYMQRESDYEDSVYGLDDDTIIQLWTSMEDTSYDLLHWNCSNICKLLILSSMPEKDREVLDESVGCTPQDLLTFSGSVDLFERLRYLATSPFIDCRPDDVRRLVDAYNLLGSSHANQGEIEATPTPSCEAADPVQ